MIVVAICRPDVDRDLAKHAARLLWALGQRDAEFYVWGNDADA